MTIKAIYEDGVLRPVTPLKGVAEHSRVTLTIEPNSSSPHPALKHSFGVLSDEDAAQMTQDIEEAFEKVDPDDWK